MRKAFLLCLSVLCLLLAGCTADADPFAALRGSYVAEVEGTLGDLSFGALIEAHGVGEEILPLTVTFYAPSSLSGTRIKKGADGVIYLVYDDVEVRASGVAFRGLLEVFEPLSSVSEIALNDAGHSVVTGEEGRMEFLSDGVPYGAERGDVSIRFIRFEQK